MAFSDFDKLKSFFFELKHSGFHPDKMRARFVMNGGWATINKPECFNLLRKKIPDLAGKDDAYVIKYLSNRSNVENRILPKFTVGEKTELTQTLAEKSSSAEGVSGQPSGQAASAEQAAPVSPTTGTSTGGMPSMPSVSTPAIHPIYRSGNITATPPPTIAIADSRGNIVREPTIPTRGRFNFSAFKSRVSNLASKAQSIASPAGPFLKVNLGRMIPPVVMSNSIVSTTFPP